MTTINRPDRRTSIPTRLGRRVARHAGLLSTDLLDREIDTRGQMTALRDAILNRDDPLTCTLARRISELDPGHPQARELQAIIAVSPGNRTLN